MVTTNNMTSITPASNGSGRRVAPTFPMPMGRLTPRQDSDIGSYLRATVTYKDPESGRDTKRANVRSDYVVLRVRIR